VYNPMEGPLRKTVCLDSACLSYAGLCSSHRMTEAPGAFRRVCALVHMAHRKDMIYEEGD